jgi:RNA polymerase sigma-70 factor (ECF subfamily)
VRAALAALPDRQREALVLRRYHDLSQEEIAGAMHTSVAAVESLLSRAMAALRIRLAAEGRLE